MEALRKVLLGAIIVVICAIITFSIVSYAANESAYYSYTKSIKSCDSDGCMVQDLIVHCLGDQVIDIKPIAKHISVSNDFEGDDPFVWCDL